jgi:hypothetical protein
MQALRNFSSSEQQRAALAQLAMVDTRTVINLLVTSDQTEELVSSLIEYPGALERLCYSEFCPRWLNSLVRDFLSEAGSPILS